MSDSDTIVVERMADGRLVQVLPDGSIRPLKPSRTDWERLAAMTEEEIEANARADPDNPPISNEELKFFRRVVNVREIRKRQNLTQKQFSDRYRIPLGTLRDWEQRGRIPDGAATTLLRIIDKYPEIVLEVLAEEFGEPTVEDETSAESPAPAELAGAAERSR
jgi:putative transcriptional regulator